MSNTLTAEALVERLRAFADRIESGETNVTTRSGDVHFFVEPFCAGGGGQIGRGDAYLFPRRILVPAVPYVPSPEEKIAEEVTRVFRRPKSVTREGDRFVVEFGKGSPTLRKYPDSWALAFPCAARSPVFGGDTLEAVKEQYLQWLEEQARHQDALGCSDP